MTTIIQADKTIHHLTSGPLLRLLLHSVNDEVNQTVKIPADSFIVLQMAGGQHRWDDVS